MRLAASSAFALVTLLVLAGCASPREPSPTSPATSSAPKAKPADPAVSTNFTYSPRNPFDEEAVAFSSSAKVPPGGSVREWHWDFGDGTSVNGSPASHRFAPGNWTVTLRMTASNGKVATAAQTIEVIDGGGSSEEWIDEALDPGPAANQTNLEPLPPTTFPCGAVEPHATFGRDSTALPDLAWAALKDGSRLAVVWSSATPTTGSITYGAKGTETTLTETVPTKVHLFVIEGLPIGKTLCFQANEGTAQSALHGVWSANAMSAYERLAPGGLGSYRLNLLVLVNEGGDLSEVEPGMDNYARMLYDATDGHVRAGTVLVVVADYLHHNSGWVACGALGLSSPGCSPVFDVMFTEDAAPQGAASTYRMGIEDPTAAIWMNMHFQAFPGPLSMDDTGAVLLHEVGHYAFDMDDLYGDNTVVTSECFDSATGISIMAGSREATEFDDDATRCPNQPEGYHTSWSLMRNHYGDLPQRPNGPMKGPSGTGGDYFRITYTGL